ncbi:MAG: FHA domain-containing protein [Acidobacteria bacterium]|nr:FHA domain-containing protein [Acidobacteriota bacterium]
MIVDGPGKGRVATLGMGVNSIGRDPAERVSLDYGDAMISRTNHGAITYDPRGQKFYVQHGGGTNLTYVNDEPVLEPRELEPLTHVQIGNTVLRFVPLCGVNFSWQDEPDRD